MVFSIINSQKGIENPYFNSKAKVLLKVDFENDSEPLIHNL